MLWLYFYVLSYWNGPDEFQCSFDQVEPPDMYKKFSLFRSIAFASSDSTTTSESAVVVNLDFLPHGICIDRLSTDCKRGILENADVL